jgi:hypothetical protein
VVDHVDEVLVVQFGQEIGLDLIGGLLAGAGQVDLEGEKVVVLAAEIDAEWREAYLACPPSPSRKWIWYSSAYCYASIK